MKSKNRIITLQITQELTSHVFSKLNNRTAAEEASETLLFGLTVEGIDNPPREGYLDLFEASLRVSPDIQLEEGPDSEGHTSEKKPELLRKSK